MKTRPITPARIEFGELPSAPDFGDVYHPRIGALAQARHVFLQGNGLPERWRGRRRFVIVETGFGLGNNFLAAWDAWRADPQRCDELHFVSVEKHPPIRADLARAHEGSPLPALAAELIEHWPELTPNLHGIDFDAGRVRLLLAFGDVGELLPALRANADAFFLDGFAPARNPAMWQARVSKALGRMAAPGATLATWSVARELREGLAAAGFEAERAAGIGGKREITVARFAPRFEPPRLPDAARPDAREAIVIGAGLAGASAASALARCGLSVTVFDRNAQPAAEGSGNPGGLFHGTLNADDGPYARLFRACALQAARDFREPLAGGHVAGSSAGLLRLETAAAGLAGMQSLLQRQGLPAGYVQALSADEASTLAGVPLRAPAWFYPGGGWLAPGAFVREALAAPGIRFVGGVAAMRVERAGDGWRVLDGTGRALGESPIVVLAAAAASAQLPGPTGWPLRHTRGQVSFWNGASPLRLPVAGDGYAVPLPGGLLCGATREAGEPGEPTLREADHRINIERLQRLTGLAAPDDPRQWQGRTGWRLHTDDRLPIAGALPAPPPASARLDQARLLPRERGLFVLTALGARGLTLAPLLGRLLAAQATGSPWPLEQDLADAIDPARWAVRAARASAGAQAGG